MEHIHQRYASSGIVFPNRRLAACYFVHFVVQPILELVQSSSRFTLPAPFVPFIIRYVPKGRPILQVISATTVIHVCGNRNPTPLATKKFKLKPWQSEMMMAPSRSQRQSLAC
jgi:hypothetical protein